MKCLRHHNNALTTSRSKSREIEMHMAASTARRKCKMK
jgi:hypothetical protein